MIKWKVVIPITTSCIILIASVYIMYAQTTPPPVTTDQISNDKAALQASIIDAFTKVATLEVDSQSYTDNQISDITTKQATMSIQLDNATGELTTVTAIAQKAEAEAEDAQNTVAGATLMSSDFIDMFPCAVLNMKVGLNLLGQRVLTFMTPTPCSAWAQYSGQTGLQSTRATFSPIGTLTQSFDPTLATSFTFQMSSSIPAHGTVQAFTYASGGDKLTRQVEF